jgi:hypothetical protein
MNHPQSQWLKKMKGFSSTDGPYQVTVLPAMTQALSSFYLVVLSSLIYSIQCSMDGEREELYPKDFLIKKT